MSGYAVYPSYKEVDLGWIAAVPSHWNLQRAKYLFNRRRRQVRENDEIITAFRDGQVTLRSNRRQDGFTNALKEIGYQGVRVGDLLVHAMDGFAGAIGVSDSDGKCSPVCSVCVPVRPDAINMIYYGYLVRQLAVTDFITSLAKGIRERSTEFRYSEFSVLELVLPPVDEQQKIANFLDHETAKIDTLIEKQQQLIKLLKEKRQAVISHAVTKGLNPDAPMKDSGVEWLREVPEGWRLCSLGYCSTITTGSTPDRNVSSFWGGTIPWVKTGEVNYTDINDTEETITELAVSSTSVKLAEVGTVLMAMYGQGVTRGRVALLGIKSTFNQACAAIVPESELTSTYLKYYFMCTYHALRDGGNETSQMNLNAEIIGKFPILTPSKTEQLEIVDYLDKSVKSFDATLDSIDQALSLLKERRTALISAAVTGKIDVRNWQPPLDTSTPSMDA